MREGKETGKAPWK